jgi:hypothetical protein
MPHESQFRFQLHHLGSLPYLPVPPHLLVAARRRPRSSCRDLFAPAAMHFWLRTAPPSRVTAAGTCQSLLSSLLLLRRCDATPFVATSRVATRPRGASRQRHQFRLYRLCRRRHNTPPPFCFLIHAPAPSPVERKRTGSTGYLG